MSYNRRHNAAKPDDLHPVEVTRHYRALPGLRRRNAAERDADHPIEVTKHYRSGPPGYLSPWQRAAGMGQNELFSTGIKLSTRAAEMRRQRNPGVTKAAYRSGLKEATAAQLGKLVRIGLRTGHTVTDIKADLKATGRFTTEQIARGIAQARTAEKRQNPRAGSEEYNGPLYDFFAIQIESSPYGGEVFYRDTYRLSDMERIRRNVADMQSKGELPPGPLRFPIWDTRSDRYYPGKYVTIDISQPYDKYNPRAFENADYPKFWDGKKGNPRRGTRRYMGSTSLTASARSFASPRVLLLRDLIEAGEATPREISEYHRLIDKFNRRAFDVIETRHAKRGNPRDIGAAKIAFRVDKRGKPLAYKYSPATQRWFRIALDEAQLMLSTGKAVKVDYDSQITSETLKRPYKRSGSEPLEDWPLSSSLVNPDGKGKQKTRRLYEKFSGKQARRENSVTAPTGTPANVAKLGTLRMIETADGRKWKFRGAGAPILAADHRHKLHVVGGAYRMNPTGAECGEIVRVEYETDKPHLGQTTPAIYFHELGEETGERPTLRIDGDGLMHIDGGAYTIEADGIHN